MALDHDRVLFERDTEAALEGLELALRAAATPDPSLVSVVLERAGDAFRLRMQLPQAIRTELRELLPEQLATSTRTALAEISDWSVPDSLATEVDDGFEAVLIRRDCVESHVVACAYVMRAASPVVFEVDGLSQLLLALRSFDRCLDGRISFENAVAALGVRGCLHGTSSWLRLEEPVLATGDHGETIELPEWLVLGTPGDESVTSYLTRGLAARYIERHAAHQAEFAAELAAVFDSFAEIGEPLSLRARGWRRKFSGSAAPATHYDVRFEHREAAATSGAGAAALRRIELGVVCDDGTEASIEVRFGSCELRVFPSSSLRSVRFGGQLAEQAAADGVWAVSAPVPIGASETELVIVDGAGREFRHQLALHVE